MYLADFSRATDVSSLYPSTASGPDYLYFDSTTFSERKKTRETKKGKTTPSVSAPVKKQGKEKKGKTTPSVSAPAAPCPAAPLRAITTPLCVPPDEQLAWTGAAPACCACRAADYTALVGSPVPPHPTHPPPIPHPHPRTANSSTTTAGVVAALAAKGIKPARKIKVMPRVETEGEGLCRKPRCG